MSSNTDISRAAMLLIGKHGAQAAIHAALRADELLEAGDMDSYAVCGSGLWRR